MTESSAPLRGIALIVGSSLLFPVADGLAKLTLTTYDVLLVFWIKQLAQFVLVTLVIVTTLPLSTFTTRRPVLQLTRGAITTCTFGLFLLAISYIPLADAVAIEFVAPLLVVALSVPMLGEKVGLRRWSAVLVGLVGGLIIIRPGLGVMHWAASLMLAVAVGFALTQILSRILARTEHPMATLFYLSLVSLVLTSISVPFVWTQVDLEAWGLLIAVGAFAGGAHYLMIRAYEFGTASVLTPFTYAQLMGATAMGYLLFGELPDRWTILGAAVLVVSGLYVTYREARIQRGAMAEAVPDPRHP